MDLAADHASKGGAGFPLGPEMREAFFRCLGEVQGAIAATYSHVPAPVRKQSGLSLTDRQEELFDRLQTLTIRPDRAVVTVEIPGSKAAWQPILRFLARPEVTLEHFVRLMVLFAVIRRAAWGDEPYVLDSRFGPVLERFRQDHPCTLLDLARAFRATGLDESLLGREQLRASIQKAFPWPGEALWPYWAEHLDLLDQVLQPGDDYLIKSRRQDACAIIARFSEPPPQFVQRLWEFAFGPRDERGLAQDALGRSPGTLQRLLQELASSESGRRTIAAEWLGRLEDRAAIDPLMAAAESEKEVEPRNAMLVALEALAAPLDSLLNREALQQQAVNGLAGGVPPELDWFPLSHLPQVHWNDTNQPVSSEILQWWIVETFKLRNPEPGPMLRRYCAQLVPGERRALGQFVLEAWVGQESYTRKGPVALTCKGMVAMAAACCGPEAVPLAASYLGNWPRERAGQCRALVQMLAWIDHPAATQLLLSVSSRFKPATIQEEARRLSVALARRKSWTLEQMADRAIPSAGLDQHGELHLSYGARSFTARLSDELELVLTDGAGKKLKSLPAPRVADEASLAQESKERFAVARKELKSVLQIQRQRLYEAMCIERTWSFQDWDTCLHGHPIMRQVCRWLVWFAAQHDQPPVLFRPLGDGSLTGPDDNPIQLAGDSRIGLAHESVLPVELCRAWQRHLADYAVEPLFPQFGIPALTLSPEQGEQTVLADFKGHLIEAFTLRAKAAKLGYARGAAVDGPWFFEYARTFPGLGITSVIAFTGNFMPEENRTVALTEFYFTQQGDSELSFEGPQRIPLGKVPPVLLRECWNHWRQMAGAGSGFAPDWEKKTKLD